MIQEGLFKNHFVGRDGFIWWIGQVAPEETWKDNIPGRPAFSNEAQPGFAERYKVRIMGYHTPDREVLPDESLPWATVMYPVTAGSGGRASSQNANITQGMFVFGFFIDGDQAQQPVIMGCLGYNDYQTVQSTIEENDFGYVPFTGYKENESKRASYQVRADDSEQITSGQENASGKPINDKLTTSVSGGNTVTDSSSSEMKDDGQVKEPLSVNSDCRPLPTAKIQQIQKNLRKAVETVERSKTEWQKNLVVDTTLLDAKKKALISEGAKLVAGQAKWILGQNQKTIFEKVNTNLKDSYYNRMPNGRQDLKEEVEKVNDQLGCLFRNLADGLVGMLEGYLTDMVNKAVNVPSCASENMIGAMLGQLANAIDSSLADMFGALDGMMGDVSKMAPGESLDIIGDVLSLLECEENTGCPQTTEWSLWDGPTATSSGGIGDIMNFAKGFSDKLKNLKVPDFDFKLPFDDIAGKNSEAGCNTGPVACGPPTLDIYGGAGIGAAGNLIVSRLGEILGADMKSFGRFYDDDAQARVIDVCGIGQGADIEPIVGEYIDEDGNTQMGVLDIRVKQPGINYLGQPNGSTGGDGRVWARPDDTSLTHGDGTLNIPTPPGNIITVVPGDTVLLPPGTQVVTEPLTSGDVQVIPPEQLIGSEVLDKDKIDGVNLDDIYGAVVDKDATKQLIETAQLSLVGQGDEDIKGGSPHLVEKAGKFTSPPLPVKADPGIYPTSSTGAYPAILTLCDVFIESPGIGYEPEDTIVIEPNIGATVVPEFNEMGNLISAKVTAGGEGFTSMPNIYVKSATGFNAVLLPKFCIDRIAKDELKEFDRAQDRLVSIVDCVGVVPFPTPPPREDSITTRTLRPFSVDAFNYVPPEPKPITAADLELEVIDEFTIRVTNPVTGEQDLISSKTGIDVGDITIDPETGTITY